MRIACIGGGPAGLYLGILMKLASPRHQVTVLERNRPDDTFGFGVVFSDATLSHLAEADPVSYQAIERDFARWDDIEVHAGGEVLRSTGEVLLDIQVPPQAGVSWRSYRAEHLDTFYPQDDAGLPPEGDPPLP